MKIVYTYRAIDAGQYKIFHGGRYIGVHLRCKDNMWEFHTLNWVSGMIHTTHSLQELASTLREIESSHPHYAIAG